MQACTQNHIVYSRSVLILDVAKTVYLLYNAHMLVSGCSTFRVIYILIQNTGKLLLVNFADIFSVMYWINHIMMLDTHHEFEEDKVQTFAVCNKINRLF